MKKTILTIALLLCAVLKLLAQELEQLDLEKALQIGLQQNFGVKIAVNNLVLADIERKIGIGTAFLPVVNALYVRNYSKEDVEQQFATNPEPNQILGAKSNVENFSIAGIYGINPESIVTVQRLGKLSEISELDAKIAIENTVAGISSAYYRLVLEQQRYEVLKKTLEISQSRLDIAEARYELGGAGRRDFLTAQVDYNSDLTLVVSQEQLIQNSRVNLNELLALPAAQEFIVKDTILIQDHLLLEDLVENAYVNNKQFLVSQRMENVAYLQLREFQAQRLPNLNLSGTYVNNTSNSEAGFLLQNQREGYNYGVNISLNLFSGFTLNRRIQSAKVQRNNAQFALQQFEIQLNSDMHRAYNTYINNKSLLEIERNNYQVAVESADIALERFRLGIANYLEFRDAQVNLLTAENRLITTIFNIKEMEIELMRLSGKIYFQNSMEAITDIY
jgi:outer membrane protein